MYDLVIVGGGLAGLRVAELAESRGYRYVLVDPQDRPGGFLRYPMTRRGFRLEMPSEHLRGTVFLARPGVCHAVGRGGVRRLGCRALVVATGSREIGWAELRISSGDVAGIYTPTAVWGLLEMGYAPGRRTAVLGHLETAKMVAEDLEDVGVHVVAVSPHRIDFGSERFVGYTIAKILGHARVTKIVLAESKAYTPPPAARGPVVEADSAVIAVGHRPQVSIRWIRGFARPPMEGFFRVGGAAAPLETLRSVAASSEVTFAQVESFLSGGSRPIMVRAGPGVSYVLPRWVYRRSKPRLLYSLRVHAEALIVEETGEVIYVHGDSGLITPKQLPSGDTMTIKAAS